MSITLQSNNFDIKYLYFLQKVKNNVKQNSYFSRLIYSNDVFSLKNIYIPFTINNVQYKEQFLKTNILFDETKNSLEHLYKIEKNILEHYMEHSNENLVPSYCIYNQCKSNYIKIFKNNLLSVDSKSITIYVKISGIWHTGTNIGLTYKFI